MFSILVTIATSKKNPKPIVLGDVNGMRGHIDAVSIGDIFSLLIGIVPRFVIYFLNSVFGLNL